MPNRSKGIAKNTLLLYFRQILVLLVSLYTVRIILDALGVEDYGIFNVVGGVVSLFSFMSGTMASATQRFFSFALGKKDNKQLERVFSVNLLIYLSIIVIMVVILESIGLWFVKTHLELPADRYQSAIVLYHFSIFTFVATVITAPFLAIIIAHEDMQVYAYISIAEVVLKLLMVFSLTHFEADKLKLFGILLLVLASINAIIYVWVCIKKYRECRLHNFYWDKVLFLEIIGFTGWTLFGQLTTIFRNQGITILLNQAFNPMIVASRAVASNITGKVNIFSNNFNLSLYPPIIKSYASEDKNEMYSLIINGSKITFFLNWVFTLPMLIEMDTILNFWLKNPPEHAALFTRLGLLEVLIFSLSAPLTTAARAPGKMKVYELTLGCLQVSIFIFAWIAIKIGGEAYSVFVIAILVNLIMFGVRLFLVSNLIGMPKIRFVKSVVLPALMIISISSILSYLLRYNLPEGLKFTIASCAFSVAVTCLVMYFVGLNKEYRSLLKTKLFKYTRKLKKIVVR